MEFGISSVEQAVGGTVIGRRLTHEGEEHKDGEEHEVRLLIVCREGGAWLPVGGSREGSQNP